MARLLAVVVALLVVGACARSDDQAQFEARVRTYLLAHPEVIDEALRRLQAKLTAEDTAARARAAKQLPALRATLERDPRDFVANPSGQVTVTEFYDYRCPHCVNAAPKVLALIHNHPEVRFVFKEMPIFGPTSEHAALAAIQVKKTGGDYLGMWRDFMAARPLDDQEIDRIARRYGLARVEDTPAARKQMADVDALFKALDLDGTPAFIVGDQIIAGEDMDAVAAGIARAKARLAKRT